MAVQASASAKRVVAVLTCLAASGREFTLTELATATDMNKTTCQSVLLALVDSRYVERIESRKSYRLGAAVLALVAAVGAPQEALARARVAMEAISADLDVETTATVATDHEIVKVAQVPRPRLQGIALRPGQAVPLAQPLGAAHVAWSDVGVVSAWLERGGAPRRSAHGRSALDDLALVRSRGWSATRRPSHRTEPVERPDSQVRDIGRQSRNVRQLAAPVFGADGRVLLVVGIFEHDELDAATARAHLDRLLDATHGISAAIGGIAPPHIARP